MEEQIIHHKFIDGFFVGGNDTYAVSAERFSKEEAIKMAEVECELPYVKNYYLAVTEAWVRYKIGLNEDGEKVQGWWIEYSKYTGKKSPCPVYAFHSTSRIEKPWGFVEYEYIPQTGQYAD